MTRPPPLAAAVALSLPPTAGCPASLAPRDAPTFPPVAAAESVVGLSLDAVAVARVAAFTSGAVSQGPPASA